jgi:hypothetical protein
MVPNAIDQLAFPWLSRIRPNAPLGLFIPELDRIRRLESHLAPLAGRVEHDFCTLTPVAVESVPLGLPPKQVEPLWTLENKHPILAVGSPPPGDYLSIPKEESEPAVGFLGLVAVLTPLLNLDHAKLRILHNHALQ